MKTLAIIVAILAVFIVAGIFVSASFIGNSNSGEESIKTPSETCTSGTCPYENTGGCSATNNCGFPTCGAKTQGSSCGCGR